MRPEFGNIAVLAGGPSCEREVSLISGQAVYEALRSLGMKAFLLDPDSRLVSILKEKKASMAFIALHGVFGEDGTVQRLLDDAGILYTGPGAEASEIAFDKARAQQQFKRASVRVPDFILLKKGDPIQKVLSFPRPCVVKPSTAGSSVGISMVHEESDIKKAVDEAFRYSDTLLVDQYIRGRELTVGVLGDEVLPIVEIIPKRSFYDYEAKYKESGTRYEFPAQLTQNEASAVSEMALRAYRALNGEVMGRVDLLMDETGAAFVLEINTIPGLTGKSLLPKAAKAKGIDFPELCVRILELSLERSVCRQAEQKHGQTVKS